MTKTITSAVADKLSAVGPRVNERVVEHMVELELTKRSNAIIKGMDNLRGLQNDLKKIKPDVVTYNEDGTEASAGSYTKTAYEARKQLVEKIDKLEKALEAAIDRADMQKLYELVK